MRQFAVVLLLGVLFGSPLMTCLVPGAQLTAAERTCCQHMAGQCGAMKMPASHSCCRTQLQQGRPMLLAIRAQLTAPSLAGMLTPLAQASPKWSLADWRTDLHGPPESPPASPSILRI